MSDRHYCSIMNDEVEIRKFVRAKHQQKNFDRLFEQRVQSYGDGHRLAFAACRILHGICPKNKLQLLASQFSRSLLVQLNRLSDIQYDAALSKAEAIELVNIAERSLCKHYEFLARVFDDFADIRRECLLTAFSLQPNQARYSAVWQCARRLWPRATTNGQMAIISNSGTRHQNAVELHLRECYDEYDDNPHYDPCVAPRHIYDNRQLQKVMTKDLADDLLNLIHVPRIKTLSWSMPDCVEFAHRCLDLMNNGSAMKQHFVATTVAASHQELRYVNGQQEELDRQLLRRAVRELRATLSKAKKMPCQAVGDERALLGFAQVKSARMSKRLKTRLHTRS